MELVEKIAFVRTAGSDEEKKAAQILADEVRALGGEAHFEQFTIPDARVERATLVADGRDVDVLALRLSGSTPAEGITAPLFYGEGATELALKGAKGKIVLCNDGALVNWKNIVASGALGCILMTGDYDDDPSKTDIQNINLRPFHLEHGKIPTVYLRTCEALRLLNEGVQSVTLTLLQEEIAPVSQNVVAEINGTDLADEVIVLTAHYDSVFYSKGAWDNASGSADIMALFDYFMENRPRRTMRFIWCGAEERGLLGAKAYVAQHEDELGRIVLGFNLDMTGVRIGADHSIVTGLEATKTYIEYLAREVGHSVEVKRDTHSSDSTVFADKGIPTVSFMRRGKGAYHNRRDCIESLGAEAFAPLQEFMRVFLTRVANAEVMPIPREMPQDMVELIDKYFRRKK